MKLKTKLGISFISIASVMLYVGCSSSDSSTSAPEENGSSTQEGNGRFIDPRDGQSYKTVVIGNQEWMAENLNYGTVGSYCYSDLPTSCEEFGRLYTWETALYVCPEGWHLPTTGEFETLISNVGGKEVAGKMLKSTTRWYDGNGIDAFGFNILPAGRRDDDGSSHYAGMSTAFWSATGIDESLAYVLYLNSINESADLISGLKDYAYSVRCLRD
jgi:uncharacterized protein (TIGR02145 family)